LRLKAYGTDQKGIDLVTSGLDAEIAGAVGDDALPGSFPGYGGERDAFFGEPIGDSAPYDGVLGGACICQTQDKQNEKKAIFSSLS